jgi:hypothetical protein
MDYEIKQMLKEDNLGIYEVYYLIDYKNCKINMFGIEEKARELAAKRGLRA